MTSVIDYRRVFGIRIEMNLEIDNEQLTYIINSVAKHLDGHETDLMDFASHLHMTNAITINASEHIENVVTDLECGYELLIRLWMLDDDEYEKTAAIKCIKKHQKELAELKKLIAELDVLKGHEKAEVN